jgi:hypothetical protein
VDGRAAELAATAAAADAFLALKTLGYKEKEARFAITKALAHVGQQSASLEELIRRGLRPCERAEDAHTVQLRDLGAIREQQISMMICDRS